MGRDPSTPVVVCITGVSGYLGSRVLPLLDADPGIARVVGVDVTEPHVGSPKLEFHQMDVRDARIAKVLPGVDVVAHLAFRADAARDEGWMRSQNIDGSRNVLEAAGAAGVRKFVHLSSAAVYGAHPDNDFPMTESSPLRANPEFSYAWYKLEVERMIEAFQEDHPDVVVTVLRPPIVFGPSTQNLVSRMLEAPRYVGVKGYEPPLQLLHEEDMASAVALAIRDDLPGAYNVAPDGWLTLEEVLAVTGRKRVELPEAVAFALAGWLWRLGIGEAPPGHLNFLMHPWIVDNAKLRAAGWKPRYSNRETLADGMEARRSWIALGRARVRRAEVGRGIAAVVGIVAAAAWARRSRRSRRRPSP